MDLSRSLVSCALLVGIQCGALAQPNAGSEVHISATVPETVEPSANTRVRPGEFTITRLGHTNYPITVLVEYAGTATYGRDYAEAPRQIVMNPGERYATILVGPLDDNEVEGDETVIATLRPGPTSAPGSGYTVHPRLNSARVVIHDNDLGDHLPVVSISGSGSVQEFCPPTALCAPIAFTLQRTSPGLDRALTVFLRFTGSAVADVDYRALPSQVAFTPGQDSVTITSVPFDDTLFEGDETVTAEVSDGLDYHAHVNHHQATAVIRDNDPPAPPVVSLELVRGEAAETRIDQNAIFWGEFTVSRTGPATNELVVYLNAQQGTARYGEDYRLDPDGTSVRFQSGARSVNVRLYPIDDHLVEGSEKAVVQLVAPSSSGIPYRVDPASSSVEMVIRDNDTEPPLPVVRIETTQPIAEENSYPYRRLAFRGIFTISRTGSTAQALNVFVHYSGTATPQEDYPALPFLVRIPAGANSVELEVVPHDDQKPEPIETVVATLSHCPPDTHPPMGIPCYGGYEIDPANDRATVFIRDDGITPASLEITRPADGSSFPVGQTILIEATAIDLEGYISRVEFWDGDTQIGVSEIFFIQAPPPGTPIHHSFEWRGASAGDHVLTARAARADGTRVTSQPVRITVGPAGNRPPRASITQPAHGASLPADTPVAIVAEAHDPDGYVRSMTFLADGRKIGEVRLEFIRPPEPGQPQTFSFLWREPPPGRHSLTVRPTDDQGATTTSPAIEISVADSEPLPIVTVTVRDAFALEPQANTSLNTAAFRIRRSGATNDPLVVAYSMHGTAENGVDYETLSGLATIPAGRRSVDVNVRPLADKVREGVETVRLRIEEPPPPGPNVRVINPYRAGRPRVASAVISEVPWTATRAGAECALLPDGLRHVCFSAQAGHNFRLEASTDLLRWETVCDAPSEGGAWHFVDAEDLPRRFYRLQPEPVPLAD